LVVAGVSACREMSAARPPTASSSPARRQLVGDRDRVGRLAPAVQGGDGVEHVGVSRLVEVVGPQVSTAAAMASRDRSMAPSRDCSASRLWGGIRAVRFWITCGQAAM
jgi:hypothetical protein